MLKGFTRKFKPLEILTEEQVEAIHRATLDVLWETGVTFHHERALKLFEKNGCKVDFEGRRVHFPGALVEEYIGKAPSSWRWHARNPKNDVIIGGNTTYIWSGCGMDIVDVDTWERRPATRKDAYDGITILDALENLHMLVPYCPYFGFEGVPSIMAIPETMAAKARNSTKVQFDGYSMDCELFTIRMGKEIGGEFGGMSLAAPPLTYYEDAVNSLWRVVEAGLPLMIESGGVYGATAPVTLAGATVTNNVEDIAGLVLAQLIKPGARVWVGDFSFTASMRSGSPAFGDIGISLHQVVFNQMWRKYGVPRHNAGSGPSSAKKIDFQSGYEKAIFAFTAAASGANVIWLTGNVYGEITWSPLMAILDDDIGGMIRRFLEGVEVTDTTLAIDLINEVGPIPGHYLNKEHTREFWRKECFVPKVADRSSYPLFVKMGKKGALELAKERMEEILATHKVDPPLTSEQEQAIEDILKEAREYYRKKGMISDEEWAVYRKQIESPNYPYA